MFHVRLRLVAPLFLLAPIALRAQVFVVGVKTAEADAVTEFHPTHVPIPSEPLSDRGHLGLIRGLEAEQGFAHRQLPLGAGLTLIANGDLKPRDEEYKKMLYERGQSVGPGDRVEITALKFEGDRLVIDLNGGPYARHRFLSHASVNGLALAQEGPIATGCRISLVFEGGLPEISAGDVKALLEPLIDFKAKSSAEAYADTLPPRIRQAVAEHHILVGMDRRMVIAALGEPHDKHREHVIPGDENSPFWEEWIYGDPPDPIQFVRFRDGHVIRLEIAALGKPVEIHDKIEVAPADGDPALEAHILRNGDQQPDPEGAHPSRPPTLRKPGETGDVVENGNTVGKVKGIDDPPSASPAGKNLVAASAGGS